jgi:predicted nucleic acid-binding protein
MVGASGPKTPNLLQPRTRSSDVPIYAIDLNVFFDAIRERVRSADAGAVFQAALRHQIRIAASQEFISELERTSADQNADPVLSLAKRIPNLPTQDKTTIENLVPIIAKAVFPERAASGRLRPNDKSDILHLAHAVAAGASGYITSDSKVLSVRDFMMGQFNLDVIGLSEFVDLLDLPPNNASGPSIKQTRNFRIQVASATEVAKFLDSEHVTSDPFLAATPSYDCVRRSVSDDDGIIGVSLLVPAAGLDNPSRAIVCVRQEHAFSSTVAYFLISEQIRIC